MTTPAMAALLAAVKMDPSTSLDEACDAALLCWMLDATRPWPEPAEATLESLLDAHRTGLRDPAAWRQLRRATVALGDKGDPHVKALGQVAEAAAWPVAASTAALVELMRAICHLRAYRAALATGWTAEEHAEAAATLNGIAQGDGTRVPERHEIPAMFEARHPVLAARFVAQLDASNQAFSQFPAEVAAWIEGARR